MNAEDIKDCDVIIDAISAWVEETFPIHNKTFYHISRLIENTDKHYIKIGGTGTMFIKKNHHQQLKDWEDFPDELKPLANVLVDNLNYIRTFSNLNWTYVSPAFQYEYELPSVNHYHVKGEYYPVDQLIETKISYTDFARALIDIAENRSYFRQRIFICE